jgi:carboxypeptidase Taq
MSKAYRQLEDRFRRASLVGDAAGFLGWDSQVLMPEGSAESRAEIAAALQLVTHETLTAPEVGDLLEQAESDKLDDWQTANLREMRRRWVHKTAVEPRLVAAMARAESACEMAWRSARPASDFRAVLPLAEELLRLTVEAGEAKAAALDVDVYDALLDQYEPGGRAADIDRLFGELAGFLPELTQRVLDRQAAAPPLPLGGPFAVERQRELGVRLMEVLGFDFTRGRLDVSLHPFCGGTPDDLRITTRYDTDDFTSALMGVLHETGHALYEKQLPAAWRHQPVGNARGMALHESQSLLMEMQACRSREFLEFAAPLMRETFAADTDTSGPAWQVDNLTRIYTRVARGLIRVDADEITYPAHVILRYRLERAMIGGDLRLADLPGAWNDGMAELVGVTPPDDRLGCLQDIHWYSGAWGYFPTYTLGALAAAQIFDAATRAEPDILPGIARGDFSPLLGWLAEHVHGRGSFLSTAALIEEATGAPLGTAVFRAHLERRYLDQ